MVPGGVGSRYECLFNYLLIVTESATKAEAPPREWNGIERKQDKQKSFPIVIQFLFVFGEQSTIPPRRGGPTVGWNRLCFTQERCCYNLTSYTASCTERNEMGYVNDKISQARFELRPFHYQQPQKRDMKSRISSQTGCAQKSELTTE